MDKGTVELALWTLARAVALVAGFSAVIYARRLGIRAEYVMWAIALATAFAGTLYVLWIGVNLVVYGFWS